MVDNIRKRTCSFLAFLIISSYNVSASTILAARSSPSGEPKHESHGARYIVEGVWLALMFRSFNDICVPSTACMIPVLVLLSGVFAGGYSA